MQTLTNELIGIRTPIQPIDSESIRVRLSDIGYIDPSIILDTDNTVNVSINKNIYTITSNLIIETESNIVSTSSTITLNKENFGIQELLINAETSGEPAYVEIINYTLNNNIITLDTNEYDNRSVYIKYLTTK